MKKRLFTGCIIAVLLTGCSGNSKCCENCCSCENNSNVNTETSVAVSEPHTDTYTESLAVFTDAGNSTSAVPETEKSVEIVRIPADDGELVKIIDFIPDAVIDLRYASENNFTGKVLYDDKEAYICYGTVKKLQNVQNELLEYGYRILIWDAYRPHEAQERLWEVCPDPMFVANPAKGLTSHSRGGTLDISIVNMDGSEVVMPSGFDEFNSSADREYSDVSEEAAENAMLLERVMNSNGFTGYSGEWWDYTDTDIDSYILSPYKSEFDN